MGRARAGGGTVSNLRDKREAPEAPGGCSINIEWLRNVRMGNNKLYFYPTLLLPRIYLRNYFIYSSRYSCKKANL